MQVPLLALLDPACTLVGLISLRLEYFILLMITFGLVFATVRVLDDVVDTSIVALIPFMVMHCIIV